MGLVTLRGLTAPSRTLEHLLGVPMENDVAGESAQIYLYGFSILPSAYA